MRRMAPLIALSLLGFGAAGAALADDYPEGCVSCHVGDEPKPAAAYRLDLQLAEIGHGKGGERTKEIPTGCYRCHASDGEGAAGALGPYIHVVHFQGGDKNPFLKKYGGDCSSCHSMDPSSWQAVAKSGDRNWGLTIGGVKVDE
ncbi:MAG: hypothetical protein PVF61_03930 [Gammaproteobacteria bacterium]